MPAERVSMRHIREVLRLRFASELPQRGIAKSLGLSPGAVSGYLSRARAAGVSWPLPADLDDEQLESLLFPPPPTIATDQRPTPDWAWVHRELRRPNVTLALLWEEYRAGAPDGFGYSWFCDLYRAWAGRLKPTMRLTHLAGEKPEAAGLDRGTCPRLRLFRRRRPPDGQRQPQGRDHQGLLSRADGQPDLCRHGAALRHRHCSGAPLQAAR